MLAFATGGNLPEKTREPGVGVTCWTAHRTARRVAKATDLKLETVWVGEAVFVATVHYDSRCMSGDRRVTEGAIQQIA